MKKTYATLIAEIARLEKEAEAARRAEAAGVVARIREAIDAYGLTAQDLGFGARGSQRAAPPSASPRARKRPTATTVGVPKYRDPDTGRTWTGRGKPPDWIKGAKDRTAFLIDAASASGGGADGTAAAGKGERKGRAGARRGSTAAQRSGGGAARKGSGGRRSAAAEKTPAVQIESGAATE